jgi:hypothetical protein
LKVLVEKQSKGELSAKAIAHLLASHKGRDVENILKEKKFRYGSWDCEKRGSVGEDGFILEYVDLQKSTGDYNLVKNEVVNEFPLTPNNVAPWEDPNPDPKESVFIQFPEGKTLRLSKHYREPKASEFALPASFGFWVGEWGSKLYVVAVTKGSAAAKAKLPQGSELLNINGTDPDPLGEDEANEILNRFDKIEMKVRTPDGNIETFSIQRAKLER